MAQINNINAKKESQSFYKLYHIKGKGAVTMDDWSKTDAHKVKKVYWHHCILFNQNWNKHLKIGIWHKNSKSLSSAAM